MNHTNAILFFLIISFSYLGCMDSDDRFSLFDDHSSYDYFKRTIIPCLEEKYFHLDYLPVHNCCDECFEYFYELSYYRLAKHDFDSNLTFDELEKERLFFVFSQSCECEKYDPLTILFYVVKCFPLESSVAQNLFVLFDSVQEFRPYSRFLFSSENGLEPLKIVCCHSDSVSLMDPWKKIYFDYGKDRGLDRRVLERISQLLLPPLNLHSFKIYREFLQFYFFQKKYRSQNPPSGVVFSKENFILILIGLEHAVRNEDNMLIQEILEFFYSAKSWKVIDFSIEDNVYSFSLAEIICSYIDSDMIFDYTNGTKNCWERLFKSNKKDDALLLHGGINCLRGSWISYARATSKGQKVLLVNFFQRIVDFLGVLMNYSALDDHILVEAVSVIFEPHGFTDEMSFFIEIARVDDIETRREFVVQLLLLLQGKKQKKSYEYRITKEAFSKKMKDYFDPPQSFLSKITFGYWS